MAINSISFSPQFFRAGAAPCFGVNKLVDSGPSSVRMTSKADASYGLLVTSLAAQFAVSENSSSAVTP